jgi:hypothetical protein
MCFQKSNRVRRKSSGEEEDISGERRALKRIDERSEVVGLVVFNVSENEGAHRSKLRAKGGLGRRGTADGSE